MHLILEQKQQLSQKDDYIRDLEDYIDNLLVKVIETQPKLLQKPCLDAKNSKELTPLSNIMHYSTIPRNYNQAVPTAKPTSTSSYSNRKKRAHSFWARGSFATSPFKKLQAFMKWWHEKLSKMIHDQDCYYLLISLVIISHYSVPIITILKSHVKHINHASLVLLLFNLWPKFQYYTAYPCKLSISFISKGPTNCSLLEFSPIYWFY